MVRRHTSQRRSQMSKSVVHKITGMFRMVKKAFVNEASRNATLISNYFQIWGIKYDRL
jgi:hypothetical protein